MHTKQLLINVPSQGFTSVGTKGFVIFFQYPVGIAFGVIILPIAQGPKKSGQRQPTKDQGNRDEVENCGHDCTFRRSPLPNTIIEDDDINIAAKSGLSQPTKASGTVIRL